MSKAKFAAVKELIDEKKFDEARTLLKTIDHPVAQEWIDKLDKIAPPPTYRPVEPQGFLSPPPSVPAAKAAKPKSLTPSQTRGCLLSVLTIVIFYFVSNRSASPAPKSAPTFTEAERAAIHSTSTAEKVAFLGTEAVTNLTATVIALTPPTATPTLAPSATLTDTPIPSATPLPSATNPPPTDVVGTKSNPYPLNSAGAVRDGRFQVNQLLRNQTATVKAKNQFNEDPPSGGEYVLASVTFYCDLATDKTCTVSLMDLEIVGKNGKVYNKPFSTVLDNPFQGDVFGGGETSGIVAFIVNSNDSNFQIIVNDLGNRIFFTAGG